MSVAFTEPVSEGDDSGGDSPARYRKTRRNRGHTDVSIENVQALVGNHRMMQRNKLRKVTNDFLTDYVEEAIQSTSRAALAALNEELLGRLEVEWKQRALRNRNAENQIRSADLVELLSPLLIAAGAFDQQGFRSRGQRRTWRLSSRVGLATGAESGTGTMVSGVAGASHEQSQRNSTDGTQGDEKPTVLAAGQKLEEDERKVLRSKRVGGASDLAVYLTDLFTSMDPTHKGLVSWETFITYLIENVFNHKLGSDDGGSTQSALAAAHVRMDSTGTANMAYRGDIPLKEPPLTQHWIHGLTYIPKWEAVVGMSHNTVSVTLAEDLNHVDLHGSHKVRTQYLHHEGIVKAMTYIDSQHLLITAAAEARALRLYHVHLRQELRLFRHCSLDTPDGSVVTSMLASERLLLSDDTVKLYVGTRSGHVLTVQIADSDNESSRGGKDAFFLGKGVGQGGFNMPVSATNLLHSDAVTDMLVLPRSGRLLSCSMNGELRSHALGGEDPERSKIDYGGQATGIYSLAYCQGYEVFVSGGFEFQAYAWAENLPSSPAFALHDAVSPHTCPLLRVIAVDNTPQIYTIDVSGMTKLFDIRTLKVLGSWRVFDPMRVPQAVAYDVTSAGERETTHLGNIGSVCYTGPHNRCLLFGSKRIYKFLTETRNPDADRAHDMSEGLVGVDVGNKNFVSSTKGTVRLWSMKTGRYHASHRTDRFTTSPVTAVAVNDPSGTICVGHANGLLSVFGAESGVLLRRYAGHSARITALAIDKTNGIIISAARNGEVFTWLDRDAVTCGTRMSDHLENIYGCGMDIPAYYRRKPPQVPEEVEGAFRNPIPNSIRRVRLQIWVTHRWKKFVSRRRGHRDTNVNESLIIVKDPNSALFLNHAVQKFVLAETHLLCCAVSKKCTARLIDYSQSPAVTTHRFFHGNDRRLLSVAFDHAQNRVFTSDDYGMLYLWLAVPNRPAVLLSAWKNKCLVLSYSSPSDTFAAGGSDDDRDPDEGEVDEDKIDPDEDDMYSEDLIKLQIDVSSGGATSPKRKGKLAHTFSPATVPLVVTLHYDPIRQYLITGDDVGYVSLWEPERAYLGVVDWKTVMQSGKPAGKAPRWIFAWRPYPQSIVYLNVTPHSSYAIITAAQDNVVSLWTVHGRWISALRQGPIVARTWPFPDNDRAQSALHLLRWHKVQSLIQSHELTEYTKWRVLNPARPPLAMSIDLLLKLRRLLATDVDEETLRRDWSFIDPMSKLRRKLGYDTNRGKGNGTDNGVLKGRQGALEQLRKAGGSKASSRKLLSSVKFDNTTRPVEKAVVTRWTNALDEIRFANTMGVALPAEVALPPGLLPSASTVLAPVASLTLSPSPLPGFGGSNRRELISASGLRQQPSLNLNLDSSLVVSTSLSPYSSFGHPPTHGGLLGDRSAGSFRAGSLRMNTSPTPTGGSSGGSHSPQGSPKFKGIPKVKEETTDNGADDSEHSDGYEEDERKGSGDHRKFKHPHFNDASTEADILAQLAPPDILEQIQEEERALLKRKAEEERLHEMRLKKSHLPEERLRKLNAVQFEEAMTKAMRTIYSQDSEIRERATHRQHLIPDKRSFNVVAKLEQRGVFDAQDGMTSSKPKSPPKMSSRELARERRRLGLTLGPLEARERAMRAYSVPLASSSDPGRPRSVVGTMSLGGPNDPVIQVRTTLSVPNSGSNQTIIRSVATSSWQQHEKVPTASAKPKESRSVSDCIQETVERSRSQSLSKPEIAASQRARLKTPSGYRTGSSDLQASSSYMRLTSLDSPNAPSLDPRQVPTAGGSTVISRMAVPLRRASALDGWESDPFPLPTPTTTGKPKPHTPQRLHSSSGTRDEAPNFVLGPINADKDTSGKAQPQPTRTWGRIPPVASRTHPRPLLPQATSGTPTSLTSNLVLRGSNRPLPQ
jgi:WD40 repeat protein